MGSGSASFKGRLRFSLVTLTYLDLCGVGFLRVMGSDYGGEDFVNYLVNF